MKNLKGKIALVTGASRGIGREIALQLSQAGALVAVHYGQNRDAAEALVNEIELSGGAAFSIGADFRESSGGLKLFQEMDSILRERTGDTHFDILVNNAGIGQIATLDEMTEDTFDEVMSINVKAPFFLIQMALSRLRDEGRIINISSAVTRIAFPNVIGYSLSKGALNTLTMILAKQLGARKITVNAILPGFTETDMNEETLGSAEGRMFAAGLSTFGRWAQTRDIADIAVFLASPESRWITGQLIDASGGSHL